ncbi:MAG TPA: LemA family protein [Candidatus Methylacidiphilales bacterium]|jgi:LemA protein|nr:LemA family protein [Candidatus Methylacidiphilales bacterium]
MGKYILGCLGLLIVGIIILAIIVGANWAGSYNALVKQSQAVDSTWAEVQNQYQRRAQLIPNLVATVSGAANFEKSTLIAVTDARASVGQVKIDPSHAPDNQAELDKYKAAQDSLTSAVSRLLVVSENYPNLRSDQNFVDLQAQLEGTENRIAVARNYFNQAVQTYNSTVLSFPTNIVAGFSHFQTKPYFQANAGAENAPQVNFNFNSNAPATTNAAPANP